VSQRDVISQCRIVAAELRGTNSDLKMGGGLRRNRGGVQRGGVRPPGPNWSKRLLGVVLDSASRREAKRGQSTNRKGEMRFSSISKK